MAGIYAADGSYNVTIVSGGGGGSGGLTDTQLRASPVPVSGALTDSQLRATAVPVSGPLTDAQLRASVVPVALSPSGGSGGLSALKIISAASTNATVAKASAGRLYSIQVCNTSASYKYVKFYNLAVSPIVGTSTVISVVGVPPGGRASLTSPQGIYCSVGISYSITGGSADSDTTAVAVGDVVGSMTYL